MRLVLLAVVLVILQGGGGIVSAESDGGWREEFDRICARTSGADKMNEAELSQLILDSEKLREKISESNEPDRKVYLFRIGKCRDFFVFLKEAAATGQRP